MNEQLNVLLLEDRDEDAQLLVHELELGGFDPRWKRVDTEAGFIAALEPSLDVILADFSIPGWDPMEALEILRLRDWDVPFIIVSGTIGEELAVQAMLRGAADYLLKDRPGRLGPAVRQAIDRRRLRMEKRETDERYRDLVENKSEARLSGIIESAMDAIITIDEDRRIVLFNPAAEAMFQCSADQVMGEPLDRLIPQRYHEVHREHVEAFDTTGVSRRMAGRLGMIVGARSDGREFQAEASISKNVAAGRPFLTVILRDVSERTRVEEALRQSEVRYRQLFEANPHPMWVYDLETLAFLAVNDAAVYNYGYSRDEFMGMTIRDIRPPEDVELLRENVAAVGQYGKGDFDHAGIWRHRRKDGTLIQVEITSHVLEYGGHRSELVLANDVTQRLLAENGLRETKENLQRAVSAGNVGLWDLDLRTNEVYYSAEWKRQIGYENDELPNEPATWQERLHPDDRARVNANVNAYLANPGPHYQHEFRFRHRDGSYRSIFAQASLITDDEGKLTRLVGSHIDVTERVKMEEQFRQAQKMESVGRLAGGIAHDFNNLLTVINGTAEMGMTNVDPGSPARDYFDEIFQAGERAATLTRQLLAFSRKQVLQPAILDLGVVVGKMETMLRRLIGEDVRLTVDTTGSPVLVNADQGQLEQVVMNLAVNARDAMPRGGHLSIRVSRVAIGTSDPMPSSLVPGDYATFEVSDTGAGMDPETIARIFEPFFTTKATGKGTGLGLSTVYGIVKQSGGEIDVESHLTEGTTFRVYLPVVEERRFMDGGIIRNGVEECD